MRGFTVEGLSSGVEGTAWDFTCGGQSRVIKAIVLRNIYIYIHIQIDKDIYIYIYIYIYSQDI